MKSPVLHELSEVVKFKEVMSDFLPFDESLFNSLKSCECSCNKAFFDVVLCNVLGDLVLIRLSLFLETLLSEQIDRVLFAIMAEIKVFNGLNARPEPGHKICVAQTCDHSFSPHFDEYFESSEVEVLRLLRAYELGELFRTNCAFLSCV